MGLFSFSSVVWCAFIAYCAHTAYTFSSLLQIPKCQENEVCLQPYLRLKPNLQLFVFTSLFHSPSSENDMDLVYYNPAFNYNEDSSEDGENSNLVVKFTLPQRVRTKNSTMSLHMFVAPTNFNSKSWRQLASSSKVGHAGCSLVVHHIPPPSPYSLLGDQNKTDNASTARRSKSKGDTVQPIVHLRSIIPFSLVTDIRQLPSKRIPTDIIHKIRMQSSTQYMPIIHIEGLSQRLEHLIPIKDIETPEANFTLVYSATSMPKLKLWMQFEAALHSLEQLGFSAKDIDEVKGIFDTNLYLLAITFCVALLHLTFDLLAFKNDISFWRGRESLAGLSEGTVIWRAFAQGVIFLYLLEEDTSMLVLGPAGLAVIIELWKVRKAYKMRYSRVPPSSGGRQSNTAAAEDETRALDSEAFHYLSYLLYPLCVIGAVYSLLYVPHKSWYSWVISSLVNGVYAFGFLFMLPQLFINYKLKSVAHLPWRAFMYKAFNTFIDDLFAFIITMPTSHRLACFRDDVVFLVYLYQRWLYPVDKARVNEFGTSSNDDDKQKKKKKE